MVADAYNTNTQEVEVEGLQVPGQEEPHAKILSQYIYINMLIEFNYFP